MNLNLMYRYKLLGAIIKEEIRTCGAVVLLAESIYGKFHQYYQTQHSKPFQDSIFDIGGQ